MAPPEPTEIVREADDVLDSAAMLPGSDGGRDVPLNLEEREVVRGNVIEPQLRREVLVLIGRVLVEILPHEVDASFIDRSRAHRPGVAQLVLLVLRNLQ